MFSVLRRVLGPVLAAAMAGPVAAKVPVDALAPPALCIAAADAAAARHGIPREMMQAITLVETRRRVNGVSGPWPWTLNIDGTGYWFETRAEALARAELAVAEGAKSVDLGCFQLNLRWHGANFGSPAEMLDPETAADYAARFLASLYAESGDWMRAAGHYHSRTPEHSERYRGLVGGALARLGVGADELAGRAAPRPVAPAEAPPAPDTPVRRVRGPLLPGLMPGAARQPLILLAAAGATSRPAGAAATSHGGVALTGLGRAARPLVAATR